MGLFAGGTRTRLTDRSCVSAVMPVASGSVLNALVISSLLAPPSGRILERVVCLEHMLCLLLQRHHAENKGVQWAVLWGL